MKAKVNHCYYTIFSLEHPILPSEELDGSADNFAVQVKTNNFSTVGSIPNDIAEIASIKGLVINRISSLDSEEKSLVNQSFPGADLDKVLILE